MTLLTYFITNLIKSGTDLTFSAMDLIISVTEKLFCAMKKLFFILADPSAVRKYFISRRKYIYER